MTDSHPATLVEALRRAASRTPDDVAFVFLQDGEVESGKLTFADIDRRAQAIAARRNLIFR